MHRIRTSRRVSSLQDSDYDHEISLVDNEPIHDHEPSLSGSSSPIPGTAPSSSNLIPSTTQPASPDLDPKTKNQPQPELEPGPEPERETDHGLEPPFQLDLDANPEPPPKPQSEARPELGPSADGTFVAGPSVGLPVFNQIPPTPAAVTPHSITGETDVIKLIKNKRSSQGSRRISQTSKISVESAIDVLYENERGGILCGLPLFSSKALGGIDASGWTNAAHKPSPTNPKTATVPDPSWEWAWPEWKVNEDDDADKNGWEYSFMFSKKFSWHGPKWWNSFVRRRAWIRRRIRRPHNDSCSGHARHPSDDPCLLNPDYFTVRPAAESVRSRSSSIASRVSRMSSARGSLASFAASNGSGQGPSGAGEEIPGIKDAETLLAVLKCSRIDREKIEAVENYLENGEEDLPHLQEVMHDIMLLFIFQSSRRILLARLMQVYEETKKRAGRKRGEEKPGLDQKVGHLQAAIRHADEEVRKLEYWSDIKKLGDTGFDGEIPHSEHGPGDHDGSKETGSKEGSKSADYILGLGLKPKYEEHRWE